mgnify:CR=1 FL=1
MASFVMIFGYGIIAVPTGIVTAEVAKNVQKSTVNTKKPCKTCGNKDYPDKANFCHQCRQPL